MCAHRPLARAALAILLCFLSAGCLQTEEAIVLNKNGSGTFDLDYTGQLKEAKALASGVRMLIRPGSKPTALAEPFAPVWFRALGHGTEGFTVEGSAPVITAETRTDHVRGRYATFESAVRAHLFVCSSVRLGRHTHDPAAVAIAEGESRGPAPEGGKAEKPDSAPRRADADDPKKADAATQPSKSKAPGTPAWKLAFREDWSRRFGKVSLQQFFPLFKAQFTNLRVVRRLTLPTKVLHTNGNLMKDGRTVEWVITSDHVARPQGMDRTVVFATAKDLRLEPFTFEPSHKILRARCTAPPPPKLVKRFGSEK